MNELARLLGHLDRDGVTELVVGSGQPLTVRRDGSYVAASTEIVSRSQLARWLLGSPIEALLPSSQGIGEEGDVEIEGRRYSVQVSRRGDDLLVRIERSKAPAPPRHRVAAPPMGMKQESKQEPKPAAKPEPKPEPKSEPKPEPAMRGAPPSVQDFVLDGPSVLELRGSGAGSTATPAGNSQSARGLHAAAQAVARTPSPPVALSPPMMPPSADGSIDFTFPTEPPVARPVAPVASEPMRTKQEPAPRSPTPGSGVRFGSSSARGEQRLDSSKIPKLDAEPKLEPKPEPKLELARPLPAPEPVPVRPRTPSPAPPSPVASPPVASPPVASPPVASPPAVAPPIASPPAVAPPIASPPSASSPAIALPRTETPASKKSSRSRGASANPSSAATRTRQLSSDDKPNVELISKVVRAARAKGASDVHIAANRPLLMRVSGELVALDPAAMSAEDVETLLMPLLGVTSRETLAARGYVDLAMVIPDAGRLRGNISRQQGGLKGSFRLAYPKPPTLEELNLPKELAKVVHHHQGLVVFAGPSGHGKTTSLAALVDLINSTRAHHILTIEDPVEIEHPRKKAVVSQREVGRHTVSFAAALKASLREDPDVIVIGELRDRETVEIALTAAETGHLVMATMSTPSAAKTIDRLIDMFPPDDQQQVRASLAGALRAIVSQRLLPTTDGTAVLPAVELLTGVLPLASLIRDGKLYQLPNLMQRGRAFGMIRLDDSLADLVRAGHVTEEVAVKYADNKRDFGASLRPSSPSSSAAAAAAAAATAASSAPAAPAAPASGTATPPAKRGGLGALFGRKDRE